jgi:hypothetical protein
VQVNDVGLGSGGLVGDGGMMASVLMRLAYLAVTNAFAALRLLPMSDRDKVVEILVLRHQLAVLQRQLGPSRRASLVPIVRSCPLCSCSCLEVYCVAYSSWSVRTPCCDGTGI